MAGAAYPDGHEYAGYCSEGGDGADGGQQGGVDHGSAGSEQLGCGEEQRGTEIPGGLAVADELTDLLNQIRRSLDILVRLRVQEACAGRSQKDSIILLDSVGCHPTEIAEILGTTTNSVNPTLSRARQKAKSGGQENASKGI